MLYEFKVKYYLLGGVEEMKKKSISILLLLSIFIALINYNVLDSYAAGGSWKHDLTGWWYQYSGNSYAIGWTYIGGNWYYFTSSGYMDYSEYRDGCWLNADGSWNTKYSGGHWASDSTGWWYTDNSGWYPTSTWLWIDGSCYYFKASGYMAHDEYVDGCYVNSSGAWVSSESHTHNWVTETTYTTETTTVHNYSCNCCGATFDSADAVNNHINNNTDCFLSGAGYDERTETVETQVPHTTTKCSICGATK